MRIIVHSPGTIPVRGMRPNSACSVQVNRAICLYSANCFGDIPPKVAVLNIAKAQIVISPLFHELRGTRSKAPDDYSGKLNNIRVVFHETQYSAILKPWPLIYRKGLRPWRQQETIFCPGTMRWMVPRPR
jgi:hypothetical protein